MAETRTEKVTVVMTPTMRDELDAYAEAHDWTASTAAVNLIRQALEAIHVTWASQNGPDHTASAQQASSGPTGAANSTATVQERKD